MLNIDSEILKFYYDLQKQIMIVVDPTNQTPDGDRLKAYIVPVGTPIPENMHTIFPNPTSPGKGYDVYIHMGLYDTEKDIPNHFSDASIINWKKKIGMIHLDIIHTQDDLYLIYAVTNKNNPCFNKIDDFTDSLLPTPPTTTKFSSKKREQDKWQIENLSLKKVNNLFGKHLI